MPVLPILFAFLVGLGHAFEPDHLLAVSQLVARRDSTLLAVKDGLYWGLGHTTTLLIFGGLLLLGKVTVLRSPYFEAAVGGVLIIMGAGRLLNRQNYTLPTLMPRRRHQLAYAIGLLHGLAGSGALVLLVMSELRDPLAGLAYIAVFGLGSVAGMFGAASLMHLPFTPRMRLSRTLTSTVVVVTSLLSIGYGGWMAFEVLSFKF